MSRRSFTSSRQGYIDDMIFAESRSAIDRLTASAKTVADVTPGLLDVGMHASSMCACLCACMHVPGCTLQAPAVVPPFLRNIVSRGLTLRVPADPAGVHHPLMLMCCAHIADVDVWCTSDDSVAR